MVQSWRALQLASLEPKRQGQVVLIAWGITVSWSSPWEDIRRFIPRFC